MGLESLGCVASTAVADVAKMRSLLDDAGRMRIRKRLEGVDVEKKEFLKAALLGTGKGDVAMRRAAVLVPLCTVSGVPSVLFTRRSTALNNHAGEVCFPGGMVDEKDTTYAETALRECQEELGSKLDVEMLGRYHDFPGRGRLVVSTYVGYLGEVQVDEIQRKANKAEVEEVFTLSLSELSKVATHSTWKHPCGVDLPVFNAGDPSNRIWGLTGIILYAILYNVILQDDVPQSVSTYMGRLRESMI